MLPATLSMLVDSGRKMLDNGLTSEETLSTMREQILEPAGVRAFCDNPATVARVVDYVADEGDRARDGRGPSQRALLMCPRGSCDHRIPLAEECNGVVVDLESWAVLSYPPPALAHRPRRDVVLAGMAAGAYTVAVVDYGTVATLYHTRGRWAVSTAASFEIDDKIWIGTLTFRTVIADVLTAYGLQLLPDGRLLDQAGAPVSAEWCYTFGFHHPEYHPFNGRGQWPKRAWFIRAVHLRAFNATANKRLTPAMVRTAPADVAGFQLMAPQQIDEGLTAAARERPEETLDLMMRTNQGAQTRYTGVLDGELAEAGPHYGYILLSRDAEFASCLLESTLMENLRRMVCIRPPETVRPADRFLYMTFMATCNIATKSIFRRMFIGAAELGARGDKLIYHISSLIVESFKPRYTPGADAVSQVVDHLRGQMIEKKLMVDRAPASINIVQDFVCSPAYINLFVALLGRPAVRTWLESL